MSNDPRLHIIAVTGIVVRDGQFLILKRSQNETAYPGLWTVPGGKIVRSEYENLSKTPGSDGWDDIVKFTLRKEIAEEAGIEIEEEVQPLPDKMFIRPDNLPVLVLRFLCRYKSGEAKGGKDITDFAWATLEEAKTYNLIPGLWKELERVHKVIRPDGF